MARQLDQVFSGTGTEPELTRGMVLFGLVFPGSEGKGGESGLTRQLYWLFFGPSSELGQTRGDGPTALVFLGSNGKGERLDWPEVLTCNSCTKTFTFPFSKVDGATALQIFGGHLSALLRLIEGGVLIGIKCKIRSRAFI